VSLSPAKSTIVCFWINTINYLVARKLQEMVFRLNSASFSLNKHASSNANTISKWHIDGSLLFVKNTVLSVPVGWFVTLTQTAVTIAHTRSLTTVKCDRENRQVK
jgi:hypothetical protein